MSNSGRTQKPTQANTPKTAHESEPNVLPGPPREPSEWTGPGRFDHIRRERADSAARIHRAISGGGKAAAPAAAIPKSGGAPLDGGTREKMERSLGAPLGDVQVHTGSESAQAARGMNARAFTTGSDVHFGDGQFAPGTKEGDRLLAHELTHVVQGQRSGVQRKAKDEHAHGEGEHSHDEHELSQPGEPAEQEADAMGDHVANDLHGGGGAQKEKPGKQKAPAIGAKLDGVGRKIYRGKDDNKGDDKKDDKKKDDKKPTVKVPQTREEIRAFVAQKYPEVVTKYTKAPKTQSEEYDPLIKEIKQYKPGELGQKENREKAKDLLNRWMAIGKKLAEETKSTEAEDLRTLYNQVEKEDMPQWQQALAEQNEPKEKQAQLAHMFREELKIYVRDLMTDEKSKEFLYCRDEAVYGQKTGPTFKQLVAEKMGGGLKGDEVFDAIIKGSQTSNKDVNKGLTGNTTGIKSKL